MDATTLKTLAQTVQNALGLEPQTCSPDGHGVYHFSWAPERSFSMYLGDSRHLILRSNLLTLGTDPESTERILKILLRYNLAAFKTSYDQAISFEGETGTVFCFRRLKADQTTESTLIEALEAYLNQLDFWYKILETEAPSSVALNA